MFRTAYKQATVIALFAGLVFRALTPLGYMPAAAGSGLLFELCPEGLPAGLVFQEAGGSSHHHHGHDDSQQTAEPDQCQIGHLLFSAVAADPTMAQLDEVPSEIDLTFSSPPTYARLTASVYQSRAPPILSS